MDFVSWDNYPANDTPAAEIAMNHDFLREVTGEAGKLLIASRRFFVIL